MITQTSGIPVRAVGQQELVPARLTQRSLGGIGNLRFTAEQSGTNFSSRVGMIASGICSSLAKLGDILKSCFVGSPSD